MKALASSVDTGIGLDEGSVLCHAAWAALKTCGTDLPDMPPRPRVTAKGCPPHVVLVCDRPAVGCGDIFAYSIAQTNKPQTGDEPSGIRLTTQGSRTCTDNPQS